jgi:mediator of RNA polymerase II transcription subunit 5
MSERPTLAKLAKQSVARDISSKIFIGFYEKLVQTSPVSDNEFISSLLEITPPNTFQQKLHIRRKMLLAIELGLSNDSLLHQFWRCLAETEISSQIDYLYHFNNLIPKMLNKVDKAILKLLVNSVFGEYILAVISKVPETSTNSEPLTTSQKELLHCVVLVGGQLYDKLSAIVFKEDDTVYRIIVKMVNKLQRANLPQLSTLWIELVKKLLTRKQYTQLTGETYGGDTTHHHHHQHSQLKDRAPQHPQHPISKNLSLTNLSPDKLVRYTLAQEYSWFRALMAGWRFNGELSSVLSLYILRFIDVKDKNKPYHITRRILRANMISFAFALVNNDSNYVLYNWKNFIVSRLPKLLANLRFNEEESLERAILDAFNSLPESVVTTISDIIIGNKKQYDLRQSFVKSCILNKLITIHSFQKYFPLDSKINQQTLVNELGQANHELNLQGKFNDTLLSINSEFTSLDESELMEFINSLLVPLEYLELKQLEFTQLILKIVDDLISQKDNEKLFRLMISILNNGTILNLIVFNSGPYELLNRLVDYLDQENFNCEDEENFQDQYSYFGVILLTVISIIDTFKLDIDNIDIKDSFVVDYVNNFYLSLGDNLTNKVPDDANQEDKTIAENYSSLLTDWINALFDDSNDGLSDDLIKSISIKQMYKLIPIVYQQAIIACKIGKINFSILTGGIDYLTQIFLIPCTISIINWLLNEMLSNRGDTESLPIKVLYEIIKSNLGDESADMSIQSSGSNGGGSSSSDFDINRLIFKIVMRISGSNVLQSLKQIKSWEKSVTIKKIINIITTHVGINYIDNDKSFKHEINVDININETLKKCLTQGIISEDRIPILSLNLQFVDVYIRKNKMEFIELFIDAINAVQKNNDDETRVFINAGVFIMINASVNSNDEKQYWLEVLSTSPVELNNGGSDTTKNKVIKSDTKFELSMDFHYSSMFNDNNNVGNNTTSRSEKDDIFGDFMEDDDLFTDKQTKPTTSSKLHELTTKFKSHDNFLSGLQRIRRRYQSNHPLHRPMTLLVDKVIEDLSNMSW